MDNYSIWLAEDLRRERWRESRPVCTACDDHIQGEYVYETDRGLMCEECAEALAYDLAEEYKRDVMESWKRNPDGYTI